MNETPTTDHAEPEEPAPAEPSVTEPASPPPPPPPATPVKRLYRDPDGKLGGVCAGVAHYFDLDVTLVRVLFLVFVFSIGTGVLAYLLAWLVVPMGERELFMPPPLATRQVQTH